MKEYQVDQLNVKIYENPCEMGKEAAKEAALCIKKMLEKKAAVNIIFAAAPSQNEFLEALKTDKSIPWNKVKAYHMDEYMGLKQGTEGSFSGFLNQAIFLCVPFQSVDCMNGEGENECERYGKILRENPVDIVFMGIGENGHIAFNDPGVADFQDDKIVKLVELEPKCRQQQVNDGCFPAIEDVPTHAYTVTIPALLQAEYIFCMVPGERKAEAVKQTLTGRISETCPASILRRHKNAVLYLERDSASGLEACK